MDINKIFVVCLILILCTNDIKTSSSNSKEFNILLLGEVGSGKSCFINRFLNHQLPEIKSNHSENYIQTKEVIIHEREIKNSENKPKYKFRFIDTPGMINVQNETNQYFLNISHTLKNYNMTSINSILYFYPLDQDISNDDSKHKSIKNINYHLKEINSFFKLNEDTSKELITIIVNKRARITNEKLQILNAIKSQFKFEYVHFSTDCSEKIDEKFKNILEKKFAKLKNSNKLIKLNDDEYRTISFLISLYVEYKKYVISVFALLISLIGYLFKSDKKEPRIPNQQKRRDYIETKTGSIKNIDYEPAKIIDSIKKPKINSSDEEIIYKKTIGENDNLKSNQNSNDEFSQPQPVQDQVSIVEDYNHEEQKPNDHTNDLDSNFHILNNGKNVIQNDSDPDDRR